jgi:PmbA protein
MITPDELIELGQFGIDKAKSLGATQCEIYLISGSNTTSDLKNNTIESSQSQSISAIGIRAFKNKSSGSVSSTSFKKDSIQESVKEAIKIANVAPADKGFNNLLQLDQGLKYSEVLGLYDSSITKFSEKDLLELGEIILDTTQSEDERVITDGGMSLTSSSLAIVNNHGISKSAQFSSTSIYCYVNINVSDTNIGTGGEFWISRSAETRTLKDKAEKISKIAVDKAQKTLNSQKLDGASMPVIIHGRNAYSWLGQIIESGISAKKLYEGDSYFSDRLGSQIMTPGLSIVDNPMHPGGFGSIPFDDEGAPTSKQEIVNKDGILQKYITDSYTAYGLDLPITGHAARGNPATRPSPSLHQIHINAGEAGSIDSMIKNIKKGIYLESSLSSQFGLQGSNISEKLNRAFYIENGEIQYSVRDAMLAGTVNTFLNGITGVSSELVDEFGRKTPHIQIEGLTISGVK